MTTTNRTNTGQDGPAAMIGAEVRDSDDNKFGEVAEIYLGNETDQPEWVAVKRGLFGSHVSLVPLAKGHWDGAMLTMPFDKATLKNAPHHDPGTDLSAADERELYRYYGIAPAPRQPEAGVADAQGDGTAGQSGDDAMTRSEERLHVGTEQHQMGRARLRKHIVTENVTGTVPVSHEEAVVEREPITEANRGKATSGADLTEGEYEVTLHEERVVTAKETVPVERVRLSTETVTDEQTVSENVRKEQIDIDSTEGVDVDRTGSGSDGTGTTK
ncbi:YsnF/AvaK domain-containing protein [Prauserella marina]|uniref:YsnF/AvaK domain-containing protein n=1 Tax=Prauserella marina TaxID=530584 RepID=UPI000B86CF0B|nr:YsnF/AvaK domain-containing protein [Prauserella marina]